MQRKVPLTRRKSLRSTKRLARVSPRRAVKRAEAKERYADAHGIYFDEILQHLPSRVRDWPPLRLVHDARVCEKYVALRTLDTCSLCGGHYWQTDCIDVHHIAANAGRSDEFCNLLLLCRKCHTAIQDDPQRTREVWLAKWRVDRENCDWVRLVRLTGKWPAFDDL